MKFSGTKYLKYLWILIPAGLTWFLFLRPSAETTETYTAQYKKMTEAVYASGNILPKNEYKVFAMAEGILTKNLVTEGDEIKENQLLFVINNNQQNIRLNTAQDAYAIAAQNYRLNSPILQELETGIQTAKNQMQNDSINWERYQNLWKENATSKIELDRAKLTYVTSKNNYQMQQARYQKTKNDLLLALQNAQSQVQLNAEQNGDYLVKSLIDGRVFEVYKEQGEAIRRGEALALIGASKEVYIQLEVDELDINKLKIGQEILIKVDVYKDQIFKAKVSKIYQMLNKQNQSFRVDAEFVDAYPSIYSGLTVEANIIIQRKEKALVVPKSYLVAKDSLWILKGEEAQKIKIQKGIENFEWVEIRSGLTAESKIIKKK